MKRLTAAAAALLLICTLALTACGANSATSGDGITVRSAGALPEKSADLKYVVEPSIQTGSTSAQDGTKVASYRFEVPSLRVCGSDGTEITTAENKRQKKALSVAASFNNHFSDWSSQADTSDIADTAREDYEADLKAGQTWQGTYEQELTYTVWQTEYLISICATYYSFTGGARPNTVLMSWNFDLDSGEFLRVAGMAADGTELKNAVTTELIRQAEKKAAAEDMKPAEMYWEDYPAIAANWEDYAVSFDKNGMNIGFSPYELACYAAGDQVFTIGYDFLKPYLSASGQSLLELSKVSK